MRVAQAPRLSSLLPLPVLPWVLPTPQTEVPAEPGGLDLLAPVKASPGQGSLRSCCAPGSLRKLEQARPPLQSTPHIGHNPGQRVWPSPSLGSLPFDPRSPFSSSSSSASGERAPLTCTSCHHPSLCELRPQSLLRLCPGLRRHQWTQTTTLGPPHSQAVPTSSGTQGCLSPTDYPWRRRGGGRERDGAQLFISGGFLSSKGVTPTSSQS